MTNKKLGLLLLPLIPLSAVGIVEVANRVLSPEPVVTAGAPMSPSTPPPTITGPQPAADA